MSPPRTEGIFRWTSAFLVLALVASRGHAQDRVADWLEREGLDRLLTEHLEATRMVGSQDSDSDTRLAEAYARLIEAEGDDSVRADLVTRARRLLANMSATTSVPLRLALARVRYLNAQQVMERSRVVDVPVVELQQRRDEMCGIAREMGALADELERRLLATRRRNADREDQELDRIAQARGAATLLAGWCWYYCGLDASDVSLGRAQNAFGSLLSGTQKIPGVDELSEARKSYEWYASAILGMAMTEASRISNAAARPWFEALRTGEANVVVADVVDGWQLAAFLDAEDFDDADAMLESFEASGRDVPTAWLRLAATGGLRGRGSGSSDAVKLSQRALAMLANRREFGDIAALVGQFGLDSVEQRGFVFDYIRGLERYREAADASRRGDDSAKRDILALAAGDFESAIRSSDAVNFPDAARSCRIQLAKTRLDLSSPREALGLLLAVIPDATGDARADATWWAIVACDRLLGDSTTDDRAELGTRRDALSRSFLEAFPTDGRAPQLMIQRISREEDPALEDLEILLALSPDHPSWRTSRERAFTILYRRYRRAAGEEARSLGRRTLEVGRSLADARHEADLIDPVIALQRDRITAEILCAPDLHDRERADVVLARLASIPAADGPAGLVDEIAYRRLMLDLLGEDFVAARGRLEAMPMGASAESRYWADLAVRKVHASAVERSRLGAVSTSVIDAIVDSGARRFEEIDDSAGVDWNDVLGREDLLAVAANVANGHRAMFVRTGDRASAETSLDWFMRCLDRRPNDRGLLESAAELSVELDDRARTLDLWRRILRRADRDTPLWWKAKAGQIAVVLVDDPAQAGRILEQVRGLEPDLGPEPWRTMLLDLERRIAVANTVRPSSDRGGDRP